MASTIFGGNTGLTYEDLQRQRAIAEALATRAAGQAPRNVGEGLSAIGAALAARKMRRQVTEQESAQRAAAAEQFGQVAQGAGIDPSLMSAMGNPYMTQGQNAVLQALIAQKLPQQAKPTDDIREYEYGQTNPAFTEYLMGLKKAGAQNITVGGGKYGTIPPGYMLQETPEGATLVPIPGGKEAREIAEQEEAAASKEKQRDTSARLVLDEIDITRQLIKESPNTTAGIVGGALSNIDQTLAGSVKNRLQTIKANIGFDKLQAMRAASPTGGALGQVSDFENRLLQATFGSLQQSQRPEDILYNLDRVEEIYNRIIHEGIPDDEARSMYRDVVLGKKALKDVGAEDAGPVPEGIDPNLWQVMTPEERALWPKN